MDIELMFLNEKKLERNQTPQSKLSLCLCCVEDFLSPSKFPRTSFLRQTEASGAYFSWRASLWRDPLEEAHALVGFALSGVETQGTNSCSRGTVPSFCFLVAMVNHC